MMAVYKTLAFYLKPFFPGSTNLMDTLDDLPPGIGQYDDFHTIDWLRDIARDRHRHREILKKRQSGGCIDKLKSAHDAWSGWVCVLLVGVASGEVTAGADPEGLGTLGMQPLLVAIFQLNQKSRFSSFLF
jgi:chloride channel 3/4/5